MLDSSEISVPLETDAKTDPLTKSLDASLDESKLLAASSATLQAPGLASSSNELLEGIANLQAQLVAQQLLLLDQDSMQAAVSSNWGFIHGLILGQISVVFVIVVFVKFFVFADPSPERQLTSSIRDALGVIVRRETNKKNSSSNSSQGDKSKSAANHDSEATIKMLSILEKTYYDVDNHAPETLDWFNVLVAQTIAQFRTEALLADNIYHSFNEFLESSPLPDFLDKVVLTEIDVGTDFPIFSNCRIKRNPDRQGRLEAKIDVDLSDTLSLGIDTRLVLNYPRPRTAVLPVELCVSIVRFSGCLTVSLVNTKDKDLGGKSGRKAASSEKSPGADPDDHGSTALMFSFLPDYRLEFTVKSLIGSRAKLQNVPKISSLIESRLRAWFTERCIEPRFQLVPLPSLWPRRRNTGGPVDE